MPAGPGERREWYWDRLRDVDLASCPVRVDIRCESPCTSRVGLIHQTRLGPMLVVRRRSEVVFGRGSTTLGSEVVSETEGKRFVVPTERRDLLNEDRTEAWLQDTEGPAEDGLLEVVCRTHGPFEVSRHRLRNWYGEGRRKAVGHPERRAI